MADNGYQLKHPKTIHLLPQEIPSEDFVAFLQKLIPRILECTEMGGGTLVQFEWDKSGQFFMVFENHIGDIRAISSDDPEWIERVRAELRHFLSEKALSEALPRTDFEDIEPSDTPETKSR